MGRTYCGSGSLDMVKHHIHKMPRWVFEKKTLLSTVCVFLYATITLFPVQESSEESDTDEVIGNDFKWSPNWWVIAFMVLNAYQVLCCRVLRRIRKLRMENELLKTLLSNPIFGTGSIVAAMLGFYYYARKMYLSMKQDVASTESMMTNLAATRQVVDMLNEQVALLTKQVNELRDVVAKQTEEQRMLIEENIKLQHKLDGYKAKLNVSA